MIASFFDYLYRIDRFAEKLIELTDRCLIMVFKTFPEIAKQDQQEAIRNSFIKTVFEKQHWKNSPQDTQTKILSKITQPTEAQISSKTHHP